MGSDGAFLRVESVSERMDETPDEVRAELLSVDRIAVVGCSATPGKAAHGVPRYMQRRGYEIVPVNPFHDEVLGERAYDALADVPGTVRLVNVFRPSAEVPGLVDQVLARHEARGDAGTVWFQLGVRDDEAAARGRANGLTVVQDRCLKVEHARLLD
jgi:hypothetical protein